MNVKLYRVSFFREVPKLWSLDLEVLSSFPSLLGKYDNNNNNNNNSSSSDNNNNNNNNNLHSAAMLAASRDMRRIELSASPL